MRILFFASGSGGHIYPSLSLISKLIDKHEIGYVVVKDSLEERIIKDQRIRKIRINISNKASYYKKSFYKIPSLLKNIIYLSKIAKQYDLIFSFGGFVSVIASVVSKLSKTPLYLHEQNRTLGDGNKFALKYAKKIFTVYEDLKIEQKYKSKVYLVGNPRGEEAAFLKVRHEHKPFKILFLAGSLGSSTLLNKIKETISKIDDKNIYFTILTGHKLYKEYKQFFNFDNVNVIEYQENMLHLMSESSLIILRAGATSLQEVISLNIPSIVIPSPYVKHNHQEENAMYYHNKKAIIMIKENEVENNLVSTILKLKNDIFLYYTLIENMKKVSLNNACTLIIKEIENEK